MGKQKKDKGPFSWGLLVSGFVLGVVFVLLFMRFGPYFRPAPPAPERPAAKIPEVETRPPEPPIEEKPAPVPSSYPRVAIVIDDMGQDLKKLKELFQLGAPVTIAVMPYQRFSGEEAKEAHDRGWDVLLHLPMEPKDSAANNPGKGALFTKMTADEVKARIEEDLRSVPHVTGVNNHMGSKFTESEPLMRAALEELKERDLFFLDSRTSPKSVGGRVARELGVPNADRNVFLDNTREKGYIKGQLREAVSIARKKGYAIAIGHPYPETIAALKEALPELEGSGVKIVRLSEVIKK